VLGDNGERMSKSRGNTVSPEETIREYGADSLRLFEVFMGDFDKAIPWSKNGLAGMSRFLQRVWKMQDKISSKAPESETVRFLHQITKNVGERIESMKFNTALAALMEMANHFNSLPMINIDHWGIFLRLLSPFAPHMCEELWERLGKTDLLCIRSWPIYDPLLITRDTVEIPVQVNGKLRQRIKLTQNTTDEEIKVQALKAVSSYTESRSIQRVIMVRGRSGVIVNVVIEA
jgi:leucyl-tRNA synthetase